MRSELVAGGVDLDSPVAVAIPGLQGDVGGWAKRHGLQASQLKDDWRYAATSPAWSATSAWCTRTSKAGEWCT